MAYTMNKSSENDLKKAIKNFNAKIKRLETSDKEIGIPEKENITAIKSRITNKWDLNREIEKLQRFTKRNSEELIKNDKGVVLTRWEFENLRREQKRLNNRLIRDIKRYGEIVPKEFGVSSDVSYAKMGDEKLSNLKARQKAISSKSIMKLNKEQIKSLQTLFMQVSL